MAINLLNMPQFQGPEPYDFRPIENALTGYRQSMDRDFGVEQNKLLGAARKARGALGAAEVADEQGRLDIAEDYRKTAVAEDETKRLKREQGFKTLAGLAQMVQEAPEEHRPAMWQKVRALDKDADQALTSLGVDPNDHDAATKVIIARARGYQDPLARRKLEADTELAESHAQYYRQGGASSGPNKGYRINPDTGEYEYIPGGPADPKVIAEQSQARGRGRQFSVNDVMKLTEEGEKYAEVKGFVTTFQDKFAGYSPYTGGLSMLAGRYGYGGDENQEAAQWWQRYDKYKNVVRNNQFGATLTPGEQAEWEKADISPEMDPKTIKNNLAIQQSIVESAVKRQASALVQGKYDPDVIQEAYGINLEELGIGRDVRGEQPLGRQGGPQQGAVPPEPRQGQDGNWYIPDPARPGKYLQVVP